MTELVPCAMLPNGPAWTSTGEPSSVCTRLGFTASASSAAIAPGARSSSIGMGRPRTSRATMIRPSRWRRSARSPASESTAMTSDAAVITHSASRTGPLPPPSPIIALRSGRSFTSTTRGQAIDPGSMPSRLP